MKTKDFFCVCLAIIFFCLAAVSCTYSITMVHTEGEAADVVDQQQAPSTSINPTIDIPVGIDESL